MSGFFVTIDISTAQFIDFMAFDFTTFDYLSTTSLTTSRPSSSFIIVTIFALP